MQKIKKILLAVGAVLVLGGAAQWAVNDQSINAPAQKKAYCRTIDSIEAENNRTVSCVRVIDVTKSSDYVYHGYALMSNGATYRFAAVWSDDYSYNLYYLNEEH